MTIKEWFYKHRNVTLVVLVAILFLNMAAWYEFLIDQRWGWLIASSFIVVAVLSSTIRWWENEQ